MPILIFRDRSRDRCRDDFGNKITVNQSKMIKNEWKMSRLFAPQKENKSVIDKILQKKAVN